MARPSDEDKLSETELTRLREVVDRGRQVYGNARYFAQVVGVSPSIVSQARHGRLVARGGHAKRLLDFEFPNDDQAGAVGVGAVYPPHDTGQIDEEIVAAIQEVTGGTRRGRRDLLKILRAAADLKRAAR